MNKPPLIKVSKDRHASQRGISLVMVLLVLVLVGLTSVSASRSSFFNETVTGNEADYSRALSAAEALVRDAQLDILGQTPTGAGCRTGVNFQGCRPSTTGQQTAAEPFFPDSTTESDELATALNGIAGGCVQGICYPQNWPTDQLADNFWLNPAQLQTNIAMAATYGQFTGAAPGATGNPILSATGANARAWYWTELIVFASNFCKDPSNIPRCTNQPLEKKPFIYRITAVALGRGSAPAVIQQYFVPFPQ